MVRYILKDNKAVFCKKMSKYFKELLEKNWKLLVEKTS